MSDTQQDRSFKKENITDERKNKSVFIKLTEHLELLENAGKD